MHQTRKRTAVFVAALAAVALVGAGCSEEDKDKAGDVTESIKATAGQLTESAKSQVGEATESMKSATETGTTVEGSAAETTSSVAPETEIAGEEVAGPILDKYNSVGGATSPLGDPTGPEESAPGGGKYQEFDGGIIYWNPETQAHIVWGEIRNAWESEGGPEGGLGYPVSDEKDIPGGKQSDFQNGYITYVDGRTQVTKN